MWWRLMPMYFDVIYAHSSLCTVSNVANLIWKIYVQTQTLNFVRNMTLWESSLFFNIKLKINEEIGLLGQNNWGNIFIFQVKYSPLSHITKIGKFPLYALHIPQYLLYNFILKIKYQNTWIQHSTYSENRQTLISILSKFKQKKVHQPPSNLDLNR